jgi:ribosome-binding protein aMBF1 (putative translation factor)
VDEQGREQAHLGGTGLAMADRKKKRTKAKVNGTSQHLGRTLRKKHHARASNSLLARFGRYLAERREEKGLSLRALARRSHMPFSNVFQMESLRKNPRLTELQQLARGFNESLLQFLEPLLLGGNAKPVQRAAEPAVEHQIAVQ